MVRRSLLSRIVFFSLFAQACGGGGETSADPPNPTWDAGQGEDASTDAGCSPKTCAMLGAECGASPDGCGGILQCGTCPEGQTCGGNGPNQCGADECVPRTCLQLGASCGHVSDGCSQVLDCGDCAARETCGGGGTPNVCAMNCPPQTKQCGNACVDQDNPDHGCTYPVDESSPCDPCPTPPNASAICNHEGFCGLQCNPDWGDCDDQTSNGCETPLTTVNHCGVCHHSCQSNGGIAVCEMGACGVVIPTWTYTHWRVDQPQGGCGEWGKIAEVKFRVAGSLVVNGATGYTSGTAGGKPIVEITHSGDSSTYGQAWKAFDGTGDPWQSYTGSYFWTGTEYLRLQVAQPIVAEEILVGGFWGSATCVRLSGSNHGTNWDVLGTSCNTDCNSTVGFKP